MLEDTQERSPNVAVIGCGFIYDRHKSAIEAVGGKIVCVCDADKEKENKIDGDIKFFNFVDKMIESEVWKEVDLVVVATPNDSHVFYTILALDEGKDVLCEKPPVIKKEDLSRIKIKEIESKGQVFFCQQLRCSSEVQELKQRVAQKKGVKGKMQLKMHRGDFYWEGWKGDKRQSGGLLFNIGVHYFDLLVWIFGKQTGYSCYYTVDGKRADGTISFENAEIEWEIDLTAAKDNQYRNLEIDGRKLNLTSGLESLHIEVYKDYLKGIGTRITDVEKAINLIDSMTYGEE